MIACLFAMCLTASLAKSAMAQGSSQGDLDEPERRQREVRERLRCYAASGTFTSKREGQERGDIVKFNLSYEDDRFHLILIPDHLESPILKYDKVVVVCDKQAVYATRFTPRLPSGCETRVVTADRQLNLSVTEWLTTD